MSDFSALVVAYSLVYLAIAGYSLYLGSRSRKLREEVETLSRRLDAASRS